ncbi:spatacsin [Nilaparvata lugens]|uniref:spatacsin n=1 Tax=Nilaparvata lugens TaxID=108931 RepID=UPI00193E257C|nr:spatacsin [Nilaparvata lugens]
MFLSLVLDVMIPYEAQFSSDAGEEVPKNFSLTIANAKSLSQEQKAIILTGLYFKTWDALLLDKLDASTCWKYLVGTNRLDLLKLWIKKDGNESTSCPNWPGEQFDQWPITQQMVDWIPEADNCLESTRQILLDWLAWWVQFIIEGATDKSWLQLWKTFTKVNESDWQQEFVLELVVKTASFISNGNMDAYLLSHPFVALAIAILQNKSLVDIEDALSISPLLAVGVQSRDEVDCKKQTSLYALLSGTTAFQTDNLFQWQRKRLTQPESDSPFPHFGCSELSAKFGHKQTVQYVDYLHNARPSFAFLQFFQENSRAHGKIPVRMQKRGANVAHGLALRCALERDRDVPSACVAFIEMLTRSSLPLRVHLAAINAIRHSDDVSHTQLTTTIEGLVSNNPSHAASLLQMLETAIHTQLTDLMTSSEDITTSAGDATTSAGDVTTIASDVTACLKLWHLPVRLSRQHNLPLPLSLPKMAANQNRWLLFVLCACIFEYPRPQTMQVLAKFASAPLREHLQYALRFEVGDEGHVVKGKLRNEREKGKNEGENLRNVKIEGEEFESEDRMLKSDSEGNVRGKLRNERGKLGNEREKFDIEGRLLKSETLENKEDTLDGEANIMVRNEKESFASEVNKVRNDRETFEATRNGREKMKKEGDKIDMMKSEREKYEALRNEKGKMKERGENFDVLESERGMFEAEDTNTSLFVQVARHGTNLTNLLTQTRKLESPGLALLSSILEPSNVVASFCEWLVASLPPNLSFPYPTSPLDWTPTDVANLLNHAVSLSFINTLQHGFEIFLKDHPLALVAEFLVDSVVHREFEKCVQDLERFKERVKGLGGGESKHVLRGGESGNVLEDVGNEHVLGGGNVLEDIDWVVTTAVRLCTTALIRCFPSFSQQHTFLKTICKAELQDNLPLPHTSQTDFRLLLALTEYMLQEGLTLDYTVIYDERSGRLDFEKQLKQLIEARRFAVAHSFATIGALSHARILLVEWRERAKTKMTDEFWSGCDAAFLAGNLAPEEAVRFYLELNEGARSQEERYKLLKYALKWVKKLYLSSTETNTQELEILLKLYHLYLEDNFNFKLILDDVSFKPLKSAKSGLIDDVTVQWLRMRRPVKQLSDVRMRRLDALIGKLLDVGDLATVCYLETLYAHKNKDSLLIDGCLGLAEGDFTTDSLPQAYAELLTNISTSHSVHGLRTSNYRHIKSTSLSLSCYSFQDLEEMTEVEDLNETIDTVCKLSEQVTHGSRITQYITAALRVAEAYHLTYKVESTSLSLSCYSFQDLEEMTEVEDLNETIDTVCKLSEQVTHGSRITQYITAALRVAEAYHLTYKEVISLEQPLSLLSGGQGCQQLQLARDLLTLAALDDAAVCVLVCQQLVASVAADCCDQLFGCNQLTDVLQLCSVQQLPQLGRLLLKAAALRRPPGDGGGKVADCSRQTVELLILAHSCFTKACNMEGISLVLNMCRKVVDALETAGKWQLMVRLMTGVGRYTEMRYVFHILKENDQFECILSNTLGKFDGLKSATLDFARGCSSDDNSQGLFTLVALHFGMYADLAAMFHESAAAALHSLKYASPPPDRSRLVRSEHNERCLQSAIDDYSHAAQHFIQAERIGRATRTVARAELVALQLSHLRAVPMGSSQHNLLEGCGTGDGEGGRLAGSYEEACVLVRGGGGVEWCDVIYANVIERGSQSFMHAFMQHHSLTPKLVYQVATRFQLDKMATAAMEKNMKQFVQLIALSDLKYRVCSQLGFKDVLSSQLTGSDHLPYLKDTVWRQGFKAAHHH